MTVHDSVTTTTNFQFTMTQPDAAALRQKVGSIRRKGINGAQEAGAAFPRSGTPSSFESADINSVLWTGRPQIVSYAVTITAGSPMPEKTKEKRRILARILHKKSASRPVVVPEVTETTATTTPASQQRTPRLGASPHLTPHSRAHSDTSYFRQGATKIQEEGEDENAPWQAAQTLSPPQKISPPNSRTASPMSKFNATRSPLVSQRSSPELKSGIDMTNSPGASTSLENTSPPVPAGFEMPRSIALRPHHPPRSTSLRDQVDAGTLARSSPQVLLSPMDEERRNEEGSDPVTVTAVEVSELEELPPSPPPKDEIVQRPVDELVGLPKPSAGLNILLPEQTTDTCLIKFGNIDYRDLSSRRENRLAGLPSPQLRPPYKSTLASRRQAIPKTIRIIKAGKKTSNVIGVIGVIVSPVQSTKGVRSPGSSWLWVQPTSPPLPKQISSSSKDAEVQPGGIAASSSADEALATVVSDTDATATLTVLQNSRKPSAGHTPMIPSKAILTDNPPSLPPMPAVTPLTVSPSRTTRIKVVAAATAPAAPSPALQKAHRRRSGNYHGAHVVTAASGQRFLRKKSTHSRKTTGIRVNGRELKPGRALNVLSGYRTSKQSANTSGMDASPATSQRRSRSPSSPSSPRLPARLTPPQAQGEWGSKNGSYGSGSSVAAARGRRQPSPLRNSDTGDKQVKPSRSTPDLLASPAPERRSHRGIRLEMGMLPRGIPFRPSAHRARTDAGQVNKTPSPVSAPAPSAPTKGHRPRAPSHTASLPLNMHVFAEAAATAEKDARAEKEAVEGRKILRDAGHKVTAEESIQRMMDKQAEQQEALRAKLLLGSSSRRPSEMSVGTI